jgi:hypothetical protein
MTREELNGMERFAAILASRMEEVTDKYEDIDDRIKDLDEEPVRYIYRAIDKIQEEYNELDDKLTDLSEAVDEFTKAIGRIKEKRVEGSIEGDKTTDLRLNKIEAFKDMIDKAEVRIDDILEEYGNNPSIGSQKTDVVFSEIREAINQLTNVNAKKADETLKE